METSEEESIPPARAKKRIRIYNPAGRAIAEMMLSIFLYAHIENALRENYSAEKIISSLPKKIHDTLHVELAPEKTFNKAILSALYRCLTSTKETNNNRHFEKLIKNGLIAFDDEYVIWKEKPFAPKTTRVREEIPFRPFFRARTQTHQLKPKNQTKISKVPLSRLKDFFEKISEDLKRIITQIKENNKAVVEVEKAPPPLPRPQLPSFAELERHIFFASGGGAVTLPPPEDRTAQKRPWPDS